MKNKFVCYYYFITFKYISLGFHICLQPLNFEIHLPFGFIRFGFVSNCNSPDNTKTFGFK